MPYCPKCGSKVDEEMSFCPKCGAALRVEQPSVVAAPQAPRAEKEEKHEKREKEEKQEKKEKTEKGEKREYGYLGPLIGGLILVVLGVMFYLATTMALGTVTWAFFIILIGIIIIVGAIYAAIMASRRHPPT
jgi:predicted lipid-binding transport protein (Tim44 family)